MKILLSNDDGINSPALRALYHSLVRAGHETRVVAPAYEQSGVSSAVTAFDPLFTEEITDGDFQGTSVCGTPADCILLAMGGLFEDVFQPDLVVSGINRGSNSSFDVLYSGTVGAAIQAALGHIPALALSSLNRDPDFTAQADKAVEIIDNFNWSDLPSHLVYNVNFPACTIEECKGLKICALSSQWQSFGHYERRTSPIGRTYWWMSGLYDRFNYGQENTDRALLLDGYITMTPLNLNYTDYETIQLLHRINPYNQD